MPWISPGKRSKLTLLSARTPGKVLEITLQDKIGLRLIFVALTAIYSSSFHESLFDILIGFFYEPVS
jgi:hypothetical protein